jgi:hypothetical protein
MKDLTGENILKERTINCSDVCTNFAVWIKVEICFNVTVFLIICIVV